jgi:hypothetical protein
VFVAIVVVDSIGVVAKKMQSTTPATAPVPLPNATKSPPVMNGDTMPPDEKKESPSSDGYLVEQPPMHPGMPIMNGNMPPQQVYVNTVMGHQHHAMMALENQFHSLGMAEGHDGSHLDMEGDDNDGGEGGEDDPVKLFVGQVRNVQMMIVLVERNETMDNSHQSIKCHCSGQPRVESFHANGAALLVIRMNFSLLPLFLIS